MKRIAMLSIIGTLAGLAVAAPHKPPRLGLIGTGTSTYRCQDGSRLAATYYNLSDDSLSLVKITVDAKTYTLPQVVSASGVRYTDLFRIEWHVKGDTGLLNRDVTDQKSVPVECTAVERKKKSPAAAGAR